MTIAVASDDGIHVAGHAGRAAGFVIAEFENNTIAHRQFRLSTFPGHAHADHHGCSHGQHHQHGPSHDGQHGHSTAHTEKHAGIRAALEGCDAMICGGMGHRLMTDLREAGIDVLLTSAPTVQAALEAYAAGTLTPSINGFCQH